LGGGGTGRKKTGATPLKIGENHPGEKPPYRNFLFVLVLESKKEGSQSIHTEEVFDDVKKLKAVLGDRS